VLGIISLLFALLVSWVIIGLALLVLALVDKLRIDSSFCAVGQHRFGPIVLRHWRSISCERAIKIASWAGGFWELLRDEFPAETEPEFILELVLDPKKGPGWKPWGESRAVVNLWEAGDLQTKGIVAEELHHIVRMRRFGDEDYVFRVDSESKQPKLERILYYALNPQETEALRFSVRVSRYRKELLCQVEDHLAGREKIELRGLAINA